MLREKNTIRKKKKENKQIPHKSKWTLRFIRNIFFIIFMLKSNRQAKQGIVYHFGEEDIV